MFRRMVVAAFLGLIIQFAITKCGERMSSNI